MKGRKLFPLLLIAAGLLAYYNSFTGEFICDDVGSILENPTIRHLWPVWQCLSPPHRGGLTVESRPLINLSLAINYALGGYNVWGYHALNLTVHILAGLTLLGIVRRTLLQPPLRDRFGAAANELALAIAVLWMIHPLQTESVTYVIQRTESIMGLFYLLTLYCFIRGAESQLVPGSTRGELRARLWYSLSVTACTLGMASKEVMVSAPLMVLLYDRAFLTRSFREAWRRRWPLYLGLSATWILLVFVVVSSAHFATTSMNAQRIGLSWREYLATEPGVILYYLRLTVWPHPLCFDFYDWPIATRWMSILPAALAVIMLLGTSAWAWRKYPVWGFVGAWFFLILAPSSSFIPLHDAIYEHRLYLSLAAAISLVVIGLYSLASRRSLAVFVVMAIGLGFLTSRRNRDYRNEIAIRVDALTKIPNNPLAHYNLGVAYGKAGRVPEAIGEFEQALRLKPDMAEAHNNLGIALGKVGRTQEQIAHYQQALQLDPKFAEAHYNLGLVLLQAGNFEQAVGEFEQALRINPDLVEAHNNLAVALMQQGRLPQAVEHFEQALRIKLDDAETHFNLGNALLRLQRLPEAMAQWQQAVSINPDLAQAHYNLAVALMQEGRSQEAIMHLEETLRIAPGMVEAQNHLARLRAAH